MAWEWRKEVFRCAEMRAMKLCRFAAATSPDTRIGLIPNAQTVVDLTGAGVSRMKDLIERADLADELRRLSKAGLLEHPLTSVRL